MFQYGTDWNYKIKRPIEKYEIFVEEMSKYSQSARDGIRFQSETKSNIINSIQITPTSQILNFPTKEQGNRILRHFSNHEDRFLRVSFTDENGGRICNQFAGYLYDIILKIREMLLNGIVVCNRKYEFLAFSTSQLRDHGCWFFAAADNVNTNSIRRWMGGKR